MQVRQARGFSLTELMIALAAGLIVSLAAVAFFMSSMRSNNDFVAATRLTQELRNNLDYVSREMRRAGYNADALTYVSLPPNSTARSPFGSINLVNGGADDSCILFAYDRGPNGSPGVVDAAWGERHGIRRMVRSVNSVNVGVIEIADSSGTVASPACDGDSPDYSTYPPTCDAGSGWCALSDPRQLNVTALNIANTAQTIAASGGNFGSVVRDYNVTITGSLINDATVTQSVNNRVRIRSECLFTAAGTVTTCTSTP